MHFKRLDLNLLVALDALLAERSVTRASERLFLTQSTTSGSLARLREYFHDDLLVQVGRQMDLTPLAESLVAPVHDILARIAQTIESKPHFVPFESDRLFRIMSSDYTTTTFLARALQHILRLAPEIKFELIPQSDDPVESLEHGDVDFIIQPDIFANRTFPSEHLFDEQYVCIVDTGNPLIGQTMSWDDYLKSGHIVTRFGNARLPGADEWFLNQYGYVRRIEVVVRTFTAIPQLVAGTNRIATVHKRLAEHYARLYPLRIMAPPVDFPDLRLVIQWQAHRSNHAAMQWCREQLIAIAREL